MCENAAPRKFNYLTIEAHTHNEGKNNIMIKINLSIIINLND